MAVTALTNLVPVIVAGGFAAGMAKQMLDVPGKRNSSSGRRAKSSPRRKRDINRELWGSPSKGLF